MLKKSFLGRGFSLFRTLDDRRAGSGNLGVATVVAEPVARGVKQDSVEPRGEGTFSSERAQVSEGSYEGLLRHVLGVVSVADEQICGAVDAILVSRDQLAKSVKVTCLTTLQNRLFVCLHLSRAFLISLHLLDTGT